MSKAYTAARVEMIEQPEPPQTRQEEDVPILFLHNIERHYRQGDETLHVLNGIELALWAGQSVALVAPSGAGKSTLLHIAGLLEHPDHGDVYIEGRATAILAVLAQTAPDVHALAERAGETGLRLTGRHPNVDFALAAAAIGLGLPRSAALGLFIIGRTVGWIAHAIEQCEMEICQIRGLGEADMTAPFQAGLRPTRHQQGQVLVIVNARVAHAAAVDVNRMIEERSIAIRSSLHFLQELGEQRNVEGVDLGDLRHLLGIIPMVAGGMVGFGDTDLGISTIALFAGELEGDHAGDVRLKCQGH